MASRGITVRSKVGLVKNSIPFGDASAPFDATLVSSQLAAQPVAWTLHWLPEVSSTQDLVREAALARAAEGWTVNVAEGDQRTMSDEEVVAAYRAGTVDDETYCWKDGMDDWLPLREIAGLYDACRAGAEFKSPGVQSSGGAPRASAAANGSGANQAPVAARRAGGRAPAADLFGGVAQAGGEDDVMTSAPAKMPRPVV